MAEPQVDAFVLFNEQENAVETIVSALEDRHVSTYFWRRDIPVGTAWSDIENKKLKDARCVLVFLGDAGWGPNHLSITKAAQVSRKRILPILIGNPPESAFDEADALFRNRRYLNLREPTQHSLDLLAQEIKTPPVVQGVPQSTRFLRILSTLIDGNEEQRSAVLKQIPTFKSMERAALAAQLRPQIEGRFAAPGPDAFASAPREPGKMGSIRSWMLSSLIWADAEGVESREVILRHLDPHVEPDRNVRFWTLAGLHDRKASYLNKFLRSRVRDTEPEVEALAEAVGRGDEPEVIRTFKSQLESPEFNTAWPILRALRVVPIPALNDVLCEQFVRAETGSSLAYDSLYALSHPLTAREVAKSLEQHPGVKTMVERILWETRNSNRNAGRNFAILLAAFEASVVDRLLTEAAGDPETRHAAQLLSDYLNEYRGIRGNEKVFVAGYISDTIKVEDDRLDIREDVQTLTAVMLAREVEPPLAIGLFGDWGTGKSFFMKSMKAAVDELAGQSTAPNSRFCSHVAQIEFNAWHYVDTNLWASLVSYILEQLAAFVTPQLTDDQQQAALLSELGSARKIVAEAEAEKVGAEAIISERQEALQAYQIERRQKEVRLEDLRAADLATLLLENQSLKEDLGNSLNEIGVPAALTSASELTDVVAEAYTVRGRATALFLALLNSRNRGTLIGMLLFVLFAIPALAYLARRHLFSDSFTVSASAIIAQITGVVIAAKTVFRRAVTAAKSSLDKVEAAKQRVDRLIAEKRATPTKAEVDLQNEIASLKAKEQEASARVAAAAARVVELEERIRAIKEGRSLARFLAERTRSEDYRKHLGLISTIRNDFESLATRLASARLIPDPGFRAADRIILYIDDLDRCPEDKVMDVLQAVHLLLAYPLFVVVVGVDPRWLLHSLGTTYSAFKADGQAAGKPDVWRATPQNYLEKIFQIQFNLRPMTSPGFDKLISKLFSSESSQESEVLNTSTPDLPIMPAETEQPTEGKASDPSPEPEVSFDSKPPTSADDRPRQAEAESGEVKPTFVVQEESLVINAWEARFAVSLFPLIPSPRAAKRFSNIYRILKARVRREELAEFEGSEEVPGDFQIPMLLLAMLIGAPAESSSVFPKLLQEAAGGRDILEVFQTLENAGLNEDAATALNEKLRPIISASSLPSAPEVFQKWIPRVSRFSFEVGRVVERVRATAKTEEEREGDSSLGLPVSEGPETIGDTR